MAHHSSEKNWQTFWFVIAAVIVTVFVIKGVPAGPVAQAAIPNPATLMAVTEQPISSETVLGRTYQRYGASTEAACKAMIVGQVNAIDTFLNSRTANIINVPPY